MNVSTFIRVMVCLMSSLVLPCITQLAAQSPKEAIAPDLNKQLFVPQQTPFATQELARKERETIDRALLDLQSDNPEIRKGAVMILSKYRAANASVAVLSALNDEDDAVRHAAVVSAMERQYTMPNGDGGMILNLIDDPLRDIRRVVSSSIPYLMRGNIGGLGKMMLPGQRNFTKMPILTPELKQKLVSAFLDEDVIVRRNMLTHYASLNLRVPDATMLQLMSDPDNEVRLGSLAMAFRYLDYRLFLEKAETLLADEDRIIRLRLVRYLYPRKNLSPFSLLEQLSKDKDIEVATEARISLFRFQPSVDNYQLMFDDYQNGGITQTQMTRVIQMVPNLGEQAERFILKFVELPDAVLRNTAVRYFFILKLNLSHPELLVKFTHDSSPNIRLQVFQYFLRSKDEISRDTLDEWLQSDYQDVRLALVRHTSKLPREMAEEYLSELIIDDDTNVRIQALNLFSKMRLPGYQRILTLSLNDESEKIQQLSVRLIAQLMGAKGRGVLSGYTRENHNTPLAAYIRQLLKQTRQVR